VLCRAAEFIHNQRTAADGCLIHHGRRLLIQRLMRTLGVVKREIFGQPNHQFSHRGITLQIHVFMLDVAPQALDKDIVKNAPPAIHADDNTFADEHAGKGVAGELGALIAVEDFRLTVSAQRILQTIDAEFSVHQFEAQGLLPSNPLLKAMAYARERREGLMVYLYDPDVQIDTNHLERALRVVPMGRRNWLFCWTELGAKHIGIMQSLLVTCRLHEVDPYDYLVDVLHHG
jgi:hypothetical protein